MTEQKPPGMAWDTWIEQQIRQAREQGAFDDLQGAGRPLPGLDAAYDPDWWVKKLVQRERVSVLPPALELLRKVERMLDEIWRLPDERQVREKVTALNVEIAKANATTMEGPATRLGVLDVDNVVSDWRARRVPPSTRSGEP